MTEPTPPPSSSPSPFDPPGGAPPPRPGGRGGPGIRKPLLIGCGILLLLLVAAFALFVAYQDSIAAWVFEAMHTELAPRLPEDLPEDVRARYEDAFELAVASAREGDYQPEDLQKVQREMTRVLREEGRMTVDDVERITAALEEVPAE